MIQDYRNKGFVLPIAVLFIGVSMGIVLSYFLWLNNKSLNLKYRIAATQALYNAETGIAESALPILYSSNLTQDTLLDGNLVNSEKYESKYFGLYEDHEVWFDDGGDRNATVEGVFTFKNFGRELTISREVTLNGQPETLGKYMYLTDSEEAGGAPFTFDPGSPPVRRSVNFYAGDALEGVIQSNSQIETSSFTGCPDFNGAQLLFTEQVPQIDLNGSCYSISQLFGGSQNVDTMTVPPVKLPPTGYEILKNNASITYDAGSKIGTGIKDTLIMTDIEFKDNGSIRVKQWWYLMPPHLKPNIGLSDFILPGAEDLDGNYPFAGDVIYDCNNDGIGNNADNACEGDELDIDGNGSTSCLSDIKSCKAYNDSLKAYHARTIHTGTEAPLLNHVRGQHGLSHYDFQPLDYDGNVDLDALLLDEERFFNKPTVIYVKNGPVRVHGTYKGRYTVVTDEFTTYKRHASRGLIAEIDTLWNNIWITDNLINNDSQVYGYIGNLQNQQPEANCDIIYTNNIMGLVSGANVIIANTRANGARNSSYGSHISINAGIIALNESFVAHYYQNTTQVTTSHGDYDGDFIPESSSEPPWGDDRGREIYGSNNTTTDSRGTIYLWGSIVQKYRGYVRRSEAPYYTGEIGYDKSYHYDENLLCDPPPFYPAIEYDNGSNEINISLQSIKQTSGD